MKAGRELDALVAEKVMGWEVENDFLPVQMRYIGDTYSSGNPLRNFNPSTDISAAWEVVEKLSEQWDVEVYRYHEVNSPNLWMCKFGELVDHDPYYWAKAHTVPLAICLAALKVVT